MSLPWYVKRGSSGLSVFLFTEFGSKWHINIQSFLVRTADWSCGIPFMQKCRALWYSRKTRWWELSNTSKIVEDSWLSKRCLIFHCICNTLATYEFHNACKYWISDCYILYFLFNCIITRVLPFFPSISRWMYFHQIACTPEANIWNLLYCGSHKAFCSVKPARKSFDLFVFRFRLTGKLNGNITSV